MLFLMRNRKDLPGPGMADATVDPRKKFWGTMDKDGMGCLRKGKKISGSFKHVPSKFRPWHTK